MKRLMRQVFLSLALLGMLVDTGCAAKAETKEQAPPAHTTPPTQDISARAHKPAWLTPEKEAALVEVRKILREARQVSEGIQPPSPALSDRHRRKALERIKNRLLNRIEEAQLQAGDVTIPATLTALSKIGFKRNLAQAQARYGFTKEAVQTVSTEAVTGDSLLVLVESLVQSGDIPAAIRVADMQLPKEGVELWRQKTAATVYSYIAEEQHKTGDLNARHTLARAIKEGPASKFAHTTEYIHGLIPLARAQADLGEKQASTETFKQAIDASLVKRRGGDFSVLLKLIAKAQAEAGDRMSSEQTFQRAIELRTRPRDLTCLAWAQAVTGQREAAMQTFKLAIEDAEKLPVEEQRRALSDLVPWQLEIGDREGALETVEIARRVGALDTIRLLSLVGNWKPMLDLARQSSDDRWKAGTFAVVANHLLKTKDPAGAAEVFKHLELDAAALLKHSPPKDQSVRDGMRTNIAEVQAAAGNLPGARETIGGIIFEPQQSVAFGKIVDLLIASGDLPAATQIVASYKEDWRPFTDSYWKVGAAYAHIGGAEAGLVWARQQQNPYAEVNGLLGLAQGLLKQQGIDKLWHSQLPGRDFCPDIFKYE